VLRVYSKKESKWQNILNIGSDLKPRVGMVYLAGRAITIEKLVLFAQFDGVDSQ
jgi:hypothetical protein